MTILEQKVTDYLTNYLGNNPTASQISAAMSDPYIISQVHNTTNVVSSEIIITSSDSIQDALDKISANGGGIVLMQPGTYTLTADISIPSGVTLQGASRDNCIIECGDFSVKIEGTDIYNTGNVSITKGSTTVTGSGTTFDVSMVGRDIWLKDSWYEIASYVSGTHIEIVDTYVGTTLTNETDYFISSINLLAQLQTLTIQNSVGSGIICNYTREPRFENINIYTSAVGLEMNFSQFPRISVSSDYNEIGAVWNNVYGYNIDFCEFSYSTVGAGLVMTKCGSSKLWIKSYW